MTWTASELAALSASESLELSAGSDGDAWVEVGFVLVDGTLFVRAFRGPGSRWFQAASNHRRGRLRVASLSRAVAFAADGEGAAEIDEAYRAKYGAASLVTNAHARAATLRITPA
ncbi:MULTISPECIES: DUF2255 family protein [unclassified Amycolatopsis]|uniref:DUF2255 family protein n=1 Tax=unclassified Amycolatopsis TaxID=2618356 RepID=UPI001C6A11F8|nr:DUF2255 family protein [Amycolatopsis sp. DSM 110486]QYN19876.1 DUF2255 family protein [Amycolatopsis sp. DSM 110486]